MKYGVCIKCFLDWYPKETYSQAAKMFYKGCYNCGCAVYYSGG